MSLTRAGWRLVHAAWPGKAISAITAIVLLVALGVPLGIPGVILAQGDAIGLTASTLLGGGSYDSISA